MRWKHKHSPELNSVITSSIQLAPLFKKVHKYRQSASPRIGSQHKEGGSVDYLEQCWKVIIIIRAPLVSWESVWLVGGVLVQQTLGTTEEQEEDRDRRTIFTLYYTDLHSPHLCSLCNWKTLCTYRILASTRKTEQNLPISLLLQTAPNLDWWM